MVLNSQTTVRPTASAIVAQHMGSVPVSVRSMADDLGLHVQYTRDLPQGVSGRIYRSRTAPSGYRIDVNATESPSRQRFTLAHEIAHYVLHRDLIGDGVTDDAMYRSSLSSVYEVQANRLAADILLPAGILKSRYEAQPSAAGLAEQFHVSEEALTIRLRQLGLTI